MGNESEIGDTVVAVLVIVITTVVLSGAVVFPLSFLSFFTAF